MENVFEACQRESRLSEQHHTWGEQGGVQSPAAGVAPEPPRHLHHAEPPVRIGEPVAFRAVQSITEPLDDGFLRPRQQIHVA